MLIWLTPLSVFAAAGITNGREAEMEWSRHYGPYGTGNFSYILLILGEAYLARVGGDFP